MELALPVCRRKWSLVGFLLDSKVVKIIRGSKGSRGFGAMGLNMWNYEGFRAVDAGIGCREI
jgi:hypothetical protein